MSTKENINNTINLITKDSTKKTNQNKNKIIK